MELLKSLVEDLRARCRVVGGEQRVDGGDAGAAEKLLGHAPLLLTVTEEQGPRQVRRPA
jgi:hypothetical protein